MTEGSANTTNEPVTTTMPVRPTAGSSTVSSPISCPAEKYQCTTNSACIDRGWLCDDEDDCEDGQDESDALCGKNQMYFIFFIANQFCSRLTNM